MVINSISSLWSLLKNTYQLNGRDIQFAYCDDIFFNVDRWYTNANDVQPTSIILTNKRLMTEEYLQYIIKRKIFVAIFTLRRKNADYSQKPDFLAKCRLLDVKNLSVIEGVKLATMETTTPVEECGGGGGKDECGGGGASRLLGEEHNNHDHEDDEDDEDSGSSSDDSDSDDQSTYDKLKMFGYVSKSSISGKGKNFGAKGLRREHWAQKAYRHFFHKFLYSIRATPYIERFAYTDEDTKV